MAIDTAARRFSALKPSIPWRFNPIIADGVLDAADRRALVGMYSGLAAGNSYSIEALAGSFSMTGNSAELTPTTNIDTSLERFAAVNIGNPWRGINVFPSGSIGRTQRQIIANYYVPYATGPTYSITCDSGVFAWVGEPSFSDFEISGIAGAFAMTGSDALLLATRTAFLSAGSYAMTGYDANLTHFTERTMVGVTGTFVMTGSDAIFSRPRGFEAQTGSFGMEGFPATLRWFNASGEPYPDPVTRRRAVGVIRRNYTYKGKRYYQLTNEELAKLIARDLIDISREDIQVTFKNKKGHKVSKEVFESLVEAAANMPVDTDDQDIEDIIALL